MYRVNTIAMWLLDMHGYCKDKLSNLLGTKLILLSLLEAGSPLTTKVPLKSISCLFLMILFVTLISFIMTAVRQAKFVPQHAVCIYICILHETCDPVLLGSIFTFVFLRRISTLQSSFFASFLANKKRNCFYNYCLYSHI